MKRNFIAFDLGAESGRVMLGTLHENMLSLDEIHRFSNGPTEIDNTLRWDISRIYGELKKGLKIIAGRQIPISGLSTDSWGVDYVLLREGKPILDAPYHYRDTRTDDGFERVFKKIEADAIFAETGIQFLPFNTIYQLNHDVEQRSELLESSDGFLNIADYINYLFSGVRRSEASLASTTQLYNPNTHEWSTMLADKLGMPSAIFPPLVHAGTKLGPLLENVAEDVNLKNVEVIATCSHDTAAAVVAVPAEGQGWAYLSSGTWSLLGVELTSPLITEKSRQLNFTNEAGYGKTIRFLKNIVGLWILQECRRIWIAEGNDYSYADLAKMAESATPLKSIINPHDLRFMKAGAMPDKIATFCRETEQPVPEKPGEFVLCILESLALLYRKTLEELESVTGMKIERLHIVGGGSKNHLLNQLSSNATGRKVLTGPAEATALGNVLVQGLALGDLKSITEARTVVRNSFAVETYLPQNPDLWQAAYDRFEKLNKPMKNPSCVNYLWDNAVATKLDAVERLVYRSNCLGADQRITNTGGGNTSSKIMEKDPLTGVSVEVLWVKGSGGDLRTSTRENFSSLYQPKLLDLQRLYATRADKGLKSPAEDEMVGMYSHTTFNLNPRPPSIDTPLHSFLPGKHVDHMHPNAVIAIAATKRCEALTREVFEGEMAYVPWMRPGFELGLAMQEISRTNPKIKAIMMGQHGFISWENEDKACYDLTLRLIEKASIYIEKKYAEKGGDVAAFGGVRYQTLPIQKREETLTRILPWLRGQIGQPKRSIATIQNDEKTLRFINSKDAPRLSELGTSCPDHFLRTKIKPLYIDWNPQSEEFDALKKKISDGLAKYRTDYASYYNTCKASNSPTMRDPNPTVVLIPGVGMIAWGKTKSESRVTAEFYNCAVEVMRGAEAIDEYVALPQQEAFDIEYWLLEEAKLQRMPAEKELARQVIVVIGAGSGIGKETAHRLAKEGAHIVCVDLNKEAAESTAKEITDKLGYGIGVAGSGISNCGPALGLQANVTDRESIRKMLDQVALAYGGFDSICVTAGIFVPSDASGHIPDDKWNATFQINVMGSYLVGDEAAKTWKEQGLKGNLVLTTSANAVVAKKGSVAYDTSKAAANHLVRELAIELSPLVRVNGVAPATVVQGSAMFPRDRVIGSLAKYNIPYTDDEATESLVSKLARFYSDRTLTKEPITPADQAEAYFLLVGNRLSKTTGQIITVDGGLFEAFLR